ncbi:glycine C-acetyltransferase [Cuniculiplasma divulgatum]|jgi:glycine C-acetyltransferase|uniref:8-amino-7-ketopelargonate synthase n=1 Tax=Cuniculiplasma divulgatum TaxID=1673428 RepID=A0A1N5SQX4_9ARCH|nr:glycine C-acetyltransferase [Cuniculiplasma divulgatum]MCI2412440.1 glycine C-acetyltransferase [Cuniculiplasma sp.]MCL4320704.1 glycine C-acetyltransferase [Candidatus Thermoplasmatota archaeon]MCL6014043.1 glycine C-acetyltransferase [Candidatus Thermoplasmatota archaeon]SIM38327.1 2-amino-3-ketobutyrate coenzyme A ligase [Cuniculiplasma divulgatum]
MTSLEWVDQELENLKNEGRYVPIRILETSQGAHVKIEGKEVLNMCSNNYLGLANNPEVKKAVVEAIDEYGIGAGAVRSIAGTMEIHMKLEEKVASFKHMESALVYQGGLLANLGTIPVLVGKEDVIFSEELNHASIIDGMRLSSAKRYVYDHMSVENLEKNLKEHRKEGKRSLIVTDGVFSMDGDIAPVKEIQELKDKYDTMFYVDDAHGEGVLGKNGRGIVDHFGLQGKVEIEMGTFSKALGSMGGFVAGSQKLIDLLKQRARPFLFSSALNPGDTAGVLKSIEIMERDDSLVKKLWENANFLQKGFRDAGFRLTSTKTPITPVVIGDEKKTLELSNYLYKNEGVFASPIVFPTVAKGVARIRVMPSAVHSKDDLKRTLEAFENGAKALKIM